MDVGNIQATLTLNTAQFNASMQSAQNQMANTSNSAKKVSKDIKLIHTASLAMGTAIAVGIGAAVKTAADFEQKMADVQAVSGATAGEMEQLGDLAKEMGLKTAFSATEAAAGIEELIKAGLTVEQIMKGGLQGALDLAVAGNLQLADAAEIASTALNAFKKDQLDVATAADILAGAANASATDVAELRYGLSMSSAVASGIGLSFRDTSTALALFAQNGLKGSDAGTSLKTMLLNLSPSTDEATGAMRDLGLLTETNTSLFYDAEGSVKSMAEIAELLHTKLSNLNDEQRQMALRTMFGTDAIRAANILYKEGAKGIDDMWSAMSKVKAVDVAKVKLDTFNGAFAEFQSTLESVGITIGEEFLPAFTDIVRFGTDLVRKFGEVDGSTIKVGLAMAGASTAILLVGSSIAKLSLALRAFALTPAGAAITALSILGGVVAGVVVHQKEMEKVSLDNANAMLEQVDSLDASINKFDELKAASKLTTEEFGRFVDINSELTATADPNVIARLKDEQAKLTQKSGLSNEQLAEMVRLNGEILKVVPNSNTALSNQGNVLLENTGAAKKYNEQQMEMIRLELEAQKAKAEASMEKNLVRRTALLKEQKQLMLDANDLDAQKIAQSKVIAGLESDLAKAKANNDAGEINRLNFSIATEKQKHQILKDQAMAAHDAVVKKQEEINKVQAQIGKLDEVKRKMVDIELRQVGINAKRGTEISAINSAISKLEKQKQTLREQTPINQRNTQEYQEAAGAIQSQINKLQGAKSKVEEIIGRAAAMNDALGKNITKTVTIQTRGETSSTWMRNKVDPDYNRHTGGTFPRKLHVGGNAAQFFANAPNHNEVDVRLLRNEMVLTEAQQANLFRLLDAGFTQTSSQSDTGGMDDLKRAIESLSSRPINVGVVVDGREIAKATAKYNQEEIDLLNARKNRMGGVS